MNKSWIWKSAIAGLCGSTAHSLLMYFKTRSGLLPAFQPYETLQLALGDWIGRDIPRLVPWAMSFVNGSTIAGPIFALSYRWLPGDNGAIKGLVYGAAGWVVMGTIFFPLLGLGLFAIDVGLGVWPALFSLAMLLTYSVVMGIVYSLLRI
jgi:hypothetical protein